ncbi:CD209 antigen-like protein C [Danio aesculapii]|uniref:CD209 antigen-like protein C n=1 Tax=Danio aesculapii TaxID=1142201 RepID=UPI0024BF1DCB|nr:CD209 antigen-like protein C [Danio aesculapii]
MPDTYEAAESTGTDGERVEMMGNIYESADCVKDLDFKTSKQQPLQQTGSDCVKNRYSRASLVRLVLLCFLLMTAVIMLSVYIYTNSTNFTNLTEERDQLLINITILTEEKAKLLTTLTNLKEEKDQQLKMMTIEKNQLVNQNKNLLNEVKQFLSKNEDLVKQTAQLQKEKNDLEKHLREQDSWFYYQSNFYFISSEEKNWNESRRYCRDRGADLIIIDNREEQDLVKKLSGGFTAWIGLTDSEDRWKWVDGTNMTTGFRFWNHGEPNGQGRGNCVASRSSGWADYPCFYPFPWICEKSTLKCQ